MITIIIIVKNDRRIENLLRSLKEIKKPEKTEVLVVDASEGKLKDIKKSFSYAQWIPFINKRKKKTTIPDQRNLGIAHAKGDIIVFIDSDCIPDKSWLVEITKPIREGHELIVAGKVILEDKASIHALESEKKEKTRYLEECPTMNVAYAKEVFDNVGYFDESFKFGSDVDFSWRARKNGIKILFNSKARISHDLGDTRNDLRRMYVYGKARMHLYKKHTYRWKFFIGNEMLYFLYPLYFLFLPITLLIPFYPLLILIPIIKYIHHKPFSVIVMNTTYGIGMGKELLFPHV